MNFVAKCCQPPGILGDFAVDRWKFIDFTRPGILRPSPCTDKKWNSPMVIDKICKMTVKSVKLKSESFFSISHGVLELWRKNLMGAHPAAPRHG